MTTETPSQVTQTEVFSFEGGYKNTYEREISSIRVTGGKLIVSGAGTDEVLTEDSEVTFENAPAVSVFVPDGCFANGTITYADNAVAPVFQNRTALPAELQGDASVQPSPSEPRGDAGGQTGSFESRTVKELQALAKERKIDVPSKATKAKLIKALRA